MPQSAACSGASEVGVMPGWVLVSKSISPASRGFVPAEIGAAQAPAAKRAMGAQGIVQAGRRDLGRDVRGQFMARAAGLYFAS
jgi:hypothetical protein